ncbi:hypothetical protein ACX0MV_08395 [Pseudomonas borbori]
MPMARSHIRQAGMLSNLLALALLTLPVPTHAASPHVGVPDIAAIQIR